MILKKKPRVGTLKYITRMYTFDKEPGFVIEGVLSDGIPIFGTW